MNNFLLRMNPINKKELEKYGTITFEGRIFKDIFGIETNLGIKDISKIPGVYQVEKDDIDYLQYLNRS